jgi:anthranilate 1,2-dioxygenase small subunit
LNLKSLTDVELQYRVERLLANYVQCIDEDRLEAWPDFFVDDCLYQVIAKENADRKMPVAAIFCDSKGMLADRIVSLRHANVYEQHHYRHIVSSIVVAEVSEGAIGVLSNYVVYRTRTNGMSEVYNTGMYRDKIVSVDGQLLFKEKIVTFDTNRIDSLMVTPL